MKRERATAGQSELRILLLTLLCAGCSGYRHVENGVAADSRWHEEAPLKAPASGSPESSPWGPAEGPPGGAAHP